jgi:hypothetical protein
MLVWEKSKKLIQEHPKRETSNILNLSFAKISDDDRAIITTLAAVQLVQLEVLH